MSNQRNWTWTNEDADHSEYDEGRLNYLAGRWNELNNDAERRHFQQLSDMDEGRDYEPEPCEFCFDGFLGIVGTPRQPGTSFSWKEDFPGIVSCLKCQTTKFLIGITCTHCDGDGYDKSAERKAAQQQAARDAEIEIVEKMLDAMGARMMRPYEHWNEDERLMQWLERDR